MALKKQIGEKEEQYAWAWRFLLFKEPKAFSLYTVYYTEGPELEKDTPAIDAFGRFLWCSSPTKLGLLQQHVRKDLACLGIAPKRIAVFDFETALDGFKSDKRDWQKWSQSIDFLNMLIDYLEFLPKTAGEMKDLCKFLGALSDHMFEKDSLRDFDDLYPNGRKRIYPCIGEAMLKVYENSTIL